jgi:galactose mutarotase-like enzyme
MPASFGSHPAFNLNFGKAELSDYFIRFEPEPNGARRFLLEAEGLGTRDEAVQWQGDELPLNDQIFDRDALVFKNLHPRTLTLQSRSNPRWVRMQCGGAPDLGIWSKPKAPFVCMEPWFGYEDPVDHRGDFSQKPGIFHIAPGSSWTTRYEIQLNDAWFAS